MSYDEDEVNGDFGMEEDMEEGEPTEEELDFGLDEEDPDKDG